ncbi:epoxide hydrolase family protein [Aspergillus homomorphus CBS 101889]|uniref:Alpha/beta-hydrolase n=1 Tax=Aspergillus homomorphus (strain CBS 101889) TaxID=1450537 RepID=A0A395HXK4_ASPHC|nr:alpha/beta-hydrolase [Aspergillus homomorphus CBS 101889]RAL10974.1 alpha/beta-hydrolase [Aspergillus homomorphus CBS 101889]
MALAYGDIPSGAEVSPKPYQLHIPDEQVEELLVLIKLAKVGPPTYESSQEDRKYGITRDWLLQARQTWKEFDWRPTEKRINSFPQFTYDIEGITVHFVALFSKKADAVPIVLLHGWPGSFLEFLPLLSLLRERYSPEELPYHVVVPSLPGFTLSSGPPLDRNFTGGDTARVIDRVMVNLGFRGGYVAQGGDIGSWIGRTLAVDHGACKAVHLNACYMDKPANVQDSAISEFERQNLARGEWFMTYGSAYAFEHGSRTSTIGNVLATNPVALLAWIGEKYLDWVDEPLPLNDILESVTLYWLTESFPRALYHYRENVPMPLFKQAEDPRWYIQKPFGFSYFPKELVPVPRAWVETTGNLVFWKEHDKGGHFAALERPTVLLDDLEGFVEQVRADIK